MNVKSCLTIGLSLLLFMGCEKSSNHTLKIAATSIPHAEILEQIKPDLEKEGIRLEIVVVDDYNTPNRALNDKEVDANFFQHQPFLDKQMKDFGYRLEPLVFVHIEPMGLYSKNLDALDQVKSGDLIGIPSDVSNQARALCLLDTDGIIKVNRCGPDTALKDIVSNPLKLKFTEIDSALLVRTLNDVALVAITTNFALQGGLSPQTDALALEDAHSQFANIVVIREGEGDRKDLQALKRALMSNKVRQFIVDHYHGAIVPAS